MSKIDSYKHLNESSQVSFKIDIEEVAGIICNMNYGFHRFLSAAVHIRRKRNENDPLAKKLEELLNEGYF